MRTALLGGTTLAVILITAIFLWSGPGGGRLSEPLPATTSGGFVIHDAAPPAPAGTATPITPQSQAQQNQPSDLDAVMQKMRANPDSATVVVTPSATSPASAPTPAPTTAASGSSATPPAPTPAPPAPLQPTPLLPMPVQWTNVTSQGTHWRFGRSAQGFLLSIDLGGGQVADVHVQPAFQNLDTAAINSRVDFLKTTILQNFSSGSGTYIFSRDGSVSIAR